ncbi:hypothetical protein [Exiguobacterium sp. s70]|uniref:hypothetical protein n=1 Tax=Exiguobacterium sp. s70 TaxID=2751228 RepID=UPI001BE6A233|nr:hypothetical protein [Exiguobacterium sp. s70]
MYDIEEGIPDSEAVVISVYGPTQVGKTTLILNLLGVKEEAINELSMFLRGKRDLGKSATVTVMRYQISDTEEYVLTLPGESATVIHTSDMLEESLAELREKVEQGQHNEIAPVLLGLPKSKFAQSNVTLELLDLPGIESADEREVGHVERCIKYWIPRSHVCLIVNSASDLTFLRDIELSHLKYWYEYPDSFYVVLTRAFSPDSVRKRLQTKEILDAIELKNYYDREITDILGFTTEMIYPIEIGHSLECLQPFEQKLAGKVMDELKENINCINRQSISFNYLTRYYEKVIRESEEEIAFLEQELNLKRTKISEHKKRQNTLDCANEEKNHADKELLEVLEEVNKNFSPFFTDLWRHGTWEHQIDKSVRQLQSHMSKKSLNNGFLELKDSFEEQINNRILKMNKSLEKLNREVASLDKNLKISAPVSIDFDMWDESKVDRYISKKNYRKQIEVMKERLLNLTIDSCESLYKEADKIYSSLHAHYKKLKEEQDLKRRFLERQKRTSNQRIKRIEREIFEDEIRLSKIQSSWQEERDHARTYMNYFVKHFNIRKEDLYRQAVNGNTKERYMAGIYLLLLERDFNHIIETLG